MSKLNLNRLLDEEHLPMDQYKELASRLILKNGTLDRELTCKRISYNSNPGDVPSEEVMELFTSTEMHESIKMVLIANFLQKHTAATRSSVSKEINFDRWKNTKDMLYGDKKLYLNSSAMRMAETLLSFSFKGVYDAWKRKAWPTSDWGSDEN